MRVRVSNLLHRLIVKTAAKTVLIIVAVILVGFAIFNFACPQHMATLLESMGNYSLAVKYANLRYYYTKDCSDLARCFDDSVLAGDNELIVDYGQQLTSHADYEKTCRALSASYGGYNYSHTVNSNLSVAYYSLGYEEGNGEYIEKAISIAAEDNGTTSFAYGNALMLLSAKVRGAGDAATAEKVLAELDKVYPTDSAETSDLNQVKKLLKQVVTSAKNSSAGINFLITYNTIYNI